MRHRKTYSYFNFQQNWVSRSVKTVHTNVFAKIISCIDLQIPIVSSKKSIISDKHHRITYMYIYFQQNRVNIEQSHPCTPTYLQKNRKLHNLQLPILISKKWIISDMYHPAMYMYIDLQQNQASRSVKTVHTNLFANNHKLH